MTEINNQKPDSRPTENIDRMRARHRNEIVELMQRCSHKNLTDWQPLDILVKQPNDQLIRKSVGLIRICKFCGKQVMRSKLVSPTLTVKK